MLTAQEQIQRESAGRWRHFRFRFRVRLDAQTAQHRLAEYLIRIGYAPAGTLEWRRGGRYHSWLVWEPRAMATRLTAQIIPQGEQTEIALHLTLDGTGHMVTGAEQETLEAELLEAARYVAQGDANFAQLEQFNRRVNERAKAALLLGIAAGIPLCILLAFALSVVLSAIGLRGALRGALVGGLSGAAMGGLCMLFIYSMLRSVRD
ncbi:MAG: hypothetical protein NZ556_00075 [Fimbriimonadales bacterium]|nr:hypothetical protein [Fimbriimonadales bacterium]